MTIHLFAHRYQAGDVVGCGRTSEVHRGRDLRMGRDVAVKVLRADLARDPSAQARFRREAQNAASLNHPSIVAVYDTGEAQGETGVVPYIVMEYVDGETLADVIARDGALPARRALEVGAEVCAALDFSHRHGIVHRNITPANVMLDRAGAAKVMDFGVARAVKKDPALTTATTIIGTAHYLAPEQARGETGDARSDIYAAGCVLFEMLCGEAPFTGDSPVAVASQHVRVAARPPSESKPGLSRDVDAIVLKALSKNPQNRYQTAAEMRKDLARAISGRAVQATPVMSQEEREQLLRAAPVRIEAPISVGASAGRGRGGSGDEHLGRPVVGRVGSGKGRSDAVASGGSGSRGASSAGVRPDGVRSDGVTSEGVTSEGVTSNGVRSNGVRSNGVTYGALGPSNGSGGSGSAGNLSLGGASGVSGPAGGRSAGGRSGAAGSALAESGAVTDPAMGSSPADWRRTDAMAPVPAAPIPHGPPLLAPVVTALPPPADDGRDPDDVARSKRRWTLIGIGALCLAVLLALTLTLMVVTTPPPPPAVAVPDLTGMSLAEATIALEEKQLTLGSVTEIDVPDTEPGTIVNQRPSFRTEVDQDTPVNVEIDK